MNKTRLRTVAWAISTAEPGLDPQYSADRYAVCKHDRLGPDVPLEKIDGDTLCDIAAWTCRSYPDLCSQGPSSECHGSWYWRNARDILELSDAEADLIFTGIVDGIAVADYSSETSTQAGARLIAIAETSVSGE